MRKLNDLEIGDYATQNGEYAKVIATPENSIGKYYGHVEYSDIPEGANILGVCDLDTDYFNSETGINYNGYELRKTNHTTGTPAQTVFEIYDSSGKLIISRTSHCTEQNCREYIDLVLN